MFWSKYGKRVSADLFLIELWLSLFSTFWVGISKEQVSRLLTIGPSAAELAFQPFTLSSLLFPALSSVEPSAEPAVEPFIFQFWCFLVLHLSSQVQNQFFNQSHLQFCSCQDFQLYWSKCRTSFSALHTFIFVIPCSFICWTKRRTSCWTLHLSILMFPGPSSVKPSAEPVL